MDDVTHRGRANGKRQHRSACLLWLLLLRGMFWTVLPLSGAVTTGEEEEEEFSRIASSSAQSTIFHVDFLHVTCPLHNCLTPLQTPTRLPLRTQERNPTHSLLGFSPSFSTILLSCAAMASSLAFVSRVQNFCSSSLLWRNCESISIRASCYQFCPSNYGSLRLKQLPRQSKKLWKMVDCAKGGKKVGDEIITEEELMGFGRLREKCKETVNGGIAELLECLEKEAIMGEDEGKEPTDYNRRAHIFEKSSIVFQAIKESTTTTTPTSTS